MQIEQIPTDGKTSENSARILTTAQIKKKLDQAFYELDIATTTKEKE